MTQFFQHLQEQETHCGMGMLDLTLQVQRHPPTGGEVGRTAQTGAAQPQQRGTDDEVLERCERQIEEQAGSPASREQP